MKKEKLKSLLKRKPKFDCLKLSHRNRVFMDSVTISYIFIKPPNETYLSFSSISAQ